MRDRGAFACFCLGLVVLACNGDRGQAENADEAATEETTDDEAESSTTTGTTSSTTVDEDSSTGDPTDDSTGCVPGELGCECSDGLCLGDLQCEAGICTECIPGQLGCECNDGLCLGDLVCEDGICMDVPCTPGELGCECNGDLCLGDLFCENGICMDCANESEEYCDGQCIDVQEDVDNCGECGHFCAVSDDLAVGGCEEGDCLPFWSECFSNNEFATCEEACAAEGKACEAFGCDGNTLGAAGNAFCTTGVLGDPSASAAGGCEQPASGMGFPAIRCCCI